MSRFKARCMYDIVRLLGPVASGWNFGTSGFVTDTLFRKKQYAEYARQMGITIDEAEAIAYRQWREEKEWIYLLR